MIEKAHNFGHFGADSNLHIIKESWPNMLALIKKVINQCATCQRNGIARMQFHPAQVTVVSKIFKRVSIDLVFGLNKNEGWFYRNSCIIEYLTKFCYAEPIRSKEASEIANILIKYISLFGPFDQGREFCNQILDKLKNNIGFRHITTSAYNPRTNGITESFNQTLIEALRKHAEANVENWPEYLPYV
ncbi:unnamed protein product [Brachionus calyciflorus]|uniref:Integrase catalytic domain-containing protein n=1 Tax=Brachionus calyciflorus TaxID=104777 RepID=A0A814SAS0_9BILA|nr:unnamed protein product [Brachionus calyciflorus]